MRKASRALLIVSSVVGFLSCFLLAGSASILGIIGLFDFVSDISDAITGSGAFALEEVDVFSVFWSDFVTFVCVIVGLLGAFFLLLGAIFVLIGLKKNKALNIIDIVISVLVFFASIFIFPFAFGLIISLIEVIANALPITLLGVIYFDFVFIFWVVVLLLLLAVISAIINSYCFGYLGMFLFSALSLTGGILGLIACHKEKKQAKEIEIEEPEITTIE